MTTESAMPTRQYINIGEGDGCYGNGCGGWGGGNFFSILLLFLLFGNGGFGGWGGNRFGGAVGADMAVQNTEAIAENRAGLNYLGQTVAGISNKLGDISSDISTSTAAIQSSLCQGFNGLNTSVLNTKFDITRAIDQCCCQTQQNIAALNANLDKATCALISAGKDNTQAILSALCNHWQEESNRTICKLEQKLNAAYIIDSLKN